jgi:transcriptional regulator with XRE-family HTH domain
MEVDVAEQDAFLGELRRLREQAGLSGRELARQMGISQSKVSRIESGATLPTGVQVTDWVAKTGASAGAHEAVRILADAAYTEVHPWDDTLREHGHLQDSIQELENSSGVKLTYEPSVVPGLLQTAEYARQLFTLFQPPYPERDIPTVVAGRLDRQTALFDPARRFEFLITEAALRFRLGSPSMMAAQIDRIASLSTLENVTIGLLPTGVPALTHVPHGFVIFEAVAGGPDALVLVETVHAGLTVSAEGHVELYRRQWSLLRQSAVFGVDARDLLARVASDAGKPGGPGR